MMALQALSLTLAIILFSMGKKPQISATIPSHVNDAITRRADLLGDSKSNYLSAIASWWFGQGAPPVRPDEEQLSALKKRLKPLPKSLDVWYLNKDDVYNITGDNVVQGLLSQLGIPNVFAPMREHDKTHALLAFENHPTHWLMFHLFKGHGEKGNGLLFEAHPKSSITREEMLTRLKAIGAEIGAKQEIVFSQLPTLPTKISSLSSAD